MQQHADFGVDAPYVPAAFLLASIGSIVFAVFGASKQASWMLWLGIANAIWFAANAASYLYTTRAGKLRVWADLLRDQKLRGDEQVLDVGCGRGVVLLTAARSVPRGKATGIDLWQVQDQSGNSESTTRENAKREGLSDRIELTTGDMRKLPFDDASFDLVVSSLAIHNVPSVEGRDKAIEEIFRVLKPGGRILVADFKFTGDYAARLRASGASKVEVRGLGWRFWYGGPYASTTLVSASKA